MAKLPPRRRMPEEEYTVRTQRDAETGTVVMERWMKDGRVHRDGAPALIHRDAITGIVVDEIWFQNGKANRSDGPAQTLRKADTGRVYYTAWYKDDVKIKPPSKPQRPKPSRKQPSPAPR